VREGPLFVAGFEGKMRHKKKKFCHVRRSKSSALLIQKVARVLERVPMVISRFVNLDDLFSRAPMYSQGID